MSFSHITLRLSSPLTPVIGVPWRPSLGAKAYYRQHDESVVEPNPSLPENFPSLKIDLENFVV